ncbi:YfgM family protein [Pseudoxanthomonas koreensis]|uniref:YfgM family protein n=1 Tax=Pseudoxanthomonas koreensis TaxID=266061 RepID=UPI0035A629B9
MAIDDLLDEHEQGERVRNWLRSNALTLVGGVLLGLAVIYGWRWWGEHRLTQSHQMHATYEQAIRQAEAGTADAGAVLAGQQGAYATLAALRVAKIQVEAGKADEAIATLRGVEADPTLQPVVTQRLAQLLIATDKADEALKLLDGQTDSAGLELRGDALLATGQREQAREEYNKALTALDVAAPSRRRLELKLQDAGGRVSDPAEPT